MNRTFLVGLVVVIIIIISAALLMMQPAPTAPAEKEYYLAQKIVDDLESGDEVVIEDDSYIFQELGDATEDEVILLMTDSIGQSVYTTVGTGTAVIVKEELPPGMPAPAPPAPLPVSVPIPVPYTGPGPTIPTAPTTPAPAPPPVTPTPSPTPAPTPNETNVTPTPPATPPAPTPAVCGNGVVESGEQCEPPGTSTCDVNCMTVIPIPYPSHCSNSVWDGDESDFNCGGSCPVCPPAAPYCDDVSNNPYYPYLCSTFLGCWENSDCASGNCDLSGAQPLPAIDPVTSTVYNTVQELRLLAGQMWIIPYSGMCQ